MPCSEILIYEKMMFIETAIKNIALESILIHADSESINDMFDKVICGYNNVPITISPKNIYLST